MKKKLNIKQIVIKRIKTASTGNPRGANTILIKLNVASPVAPAVAVPAKTLATITIIIPDIVIGTA